ncbi:hypothetical protein [Nocardioides sp. Arc9.136]|uniref:hypothetical protein n=1 Tax=Nocardioides sp. Arc9.136 TaxID=2996826 RepID=UPI002665853B|nr:hypothetical protein [Nocardioides sp. Arc9.136]WKN47127.1 hypothetical protein OSR43_13875 [Nocardioides sp. Arc9.136]
MTTTATIKAKGCKNTGITEDIAAVLHDNLGKTIVAVVELTADARSENRDGEEKVQLSIGLIEVAPDGMASEHVRELMRSFHYERRLADDGPTLHGEGDSPEPKVADVLAAGARFRPHPYLASGLAVDDNAACDVCGQREPAAVHSTQQMLEEPDQDPADNDGDTDDEADDDTDLDEDTATADDDPDEDTNSDEDGEVDPTHLHLASPFTTPGPAA